MKKLLVICAFITFSKAATAQEVGVRFGDVLGNNVALDLLLNTGASNLHADISFGSDVGLELLWQFFVEPLSADENFNLYIGAGPSLLFSDPLFFGFSGEFGLYYQFEGVPISLSADWRPTLWIVENTDFDATGFGFNVRFVFGGD